MSTANTWNANAYDQQHAFVWQHGAGVLEWLQPQPSERVLDVGCGTAQLTAQIAAQGSHVVGVDASPEMIAHAKISFPALDLRLGDARDFSFDEPFDAVFSNATLHWISASDTPRVLHCVARTLKPNGRFAFEMGGRGNISALESALQSALRDVGREDVPVGNYFPTLAEYATMLEAAGLFARRAELFSRPTPLQNGEHGLRDWYTQFRAYALNDLSVEGREQVFQTCENALRATLWNGEHWTADYVRLRMLAVKSVEAARVG